MTTPAASRRYVFVNRYYEPDESATSQMLTDLARGLAARSLEVHVICSRQLYTDPKAALLRRESRSGVSIHRVATTRFGRGLLLGRMFDYASFYFQAGWQMLRLLRRGDVVIAKTDPPLISIPAALAARLKGAALINWQQDVFPEVASHLSANPLPRWLDEHLRRVRDASLRAAEMNVTIGRGMLEYFKKRGIPEGKLCAIENWAHLAAEPKLAAHSRLRLNLGLAEKFVIGYSGNLGRAHEFDTLLGAAEVLKSEATIVFLMIGGGAKMELLRRAVSQRSLSNFIFLPYQARDALPDSLAAADLHVVSLLPELEGLILPSKLYGILASGRPAIFIGDCSGEIALDLQANRCGLAFSIKAYADLAAAIRSLEGDREACAAMGQRAREMFLTRYSLQRGIDQWVSVLVRP